LFRCFSYSVKGSCSSNWRAACACGDECDETRISRSRRLSERQPGASSRYQASSSAQAIAESI
jgi:hypothetical protein